MNVDCYLCGRPALPPLVVIENHTESGVEWGVSTEGSNPPAESFVRCRDRKHAFAVKESADRGDVMPLLRASGAVA